MWAWSKCAQFFVVSARVVVTFAREPRQNLTAEPAWSNAGPAPRGRARLRPGQQAWQDPARTRVRVGPGPNSRPCSHVLTGSAARRDSDASDPSASDGGPGRLRQYTAAADVAAVTVLRFHFKLCWRLGSMPSLGKTCPHWQPECRTVTPR
jgi:hypothetical protein